MAKMIRHDYGAIHEALNKMILAEVKAALELLSEKCIESQHIASLCRIVVSDGADYAPKDFSVYKVWIEADSLHVAGRIEDSDYDAEYTEDDDLLDITDFSYLIDQIAEKVEDDKTYNLPNMSLLTCGYVAEKDVVNNAESVVTV